MLEILEHTISKETYLDAEFSADFKNEFIDGIIRPKTFESENHSLIISNLIGLIGIKIKNSNCRVYPSNRLLHIPISNRFYYPDVMVVCGDSEFFNHKTKMQATLNPRLIVEVLSDSTQLIDRIEKWNAFQKIESLEQFILISQNEILIENYTKNKNQNTWRNEQLDTKNSIFNVLNDPIKIKEIYKHCEF